ncbi:formylglycine-generating enzyme family protein [Angustibacter speluncae]
MDGDPCCTPSRGGARDCRPPRTQDGARQAEAALGLVPVPGGTFRMGSQDADAVPGDAEGPVRDAHVDALLVGRGTVTTALWSVFADATGYVTDAERYGWSFVVRALLADDARDAVLDAHVPGAPWWVAVRDASWRAPSGPGSGTGGREDHPVVHVSWDDAQAFCAWSGTRLPTEAEWEHAARGGLVGARFPWGDEEPLGPGGPRCNVWEGAFPEPSPHDTGTVPVDAFSPNGFGLRNLVGNVWEHCQDPWLPGAAERVLRGGSYLCHVSYCNRYRVAARSRTTTDSSTANTGFRVVRDAVP